MIRWSRDGGIGEREMERGNRSRLQHHKKQGCFGIKILAIRCQNELPEKKAPFGVQRITEKEGQWRVVFLSQLYFGRLYFCLSCILKVVFLSQLYFESCIFVSAVFRKLYFGLSCILKVVFCNISSVVLRLA